MIPKPEIPPDIAHNYKQVWKLLPQSGEWLVRIDHNHKHYYIIGSVIESDLFYHSQVKVQWTEQLVATQQQKTEQIKKETEQLKVYNQLPQMLSDKDKADK